MGKYQLAPRARIDLSSIGRFTKRKWGEAQAERYLAQLESDLELLASRPGLGRRMGLKLSKNALRFESGSHFFVYEMTEKGDILVARILHKRMLPAKHGL